MSPEDVSCGYKNPPGGDRCKNTQTRRPMRLGACDGIGITMVNAW